LGPLAEAQMRNALSIGEGHWSVFVQRPGSLTLLIVILAVLIVPKWLRRAKQKTAG
jgi:putative tricarboxylic transport membrane protein